VLSKLAVYEGRLNIASYPSSARQDGKVRQTNPHQGGESPIQVQHRKGVAVFSGPA